jgi:predicted nucleotidyltransferase
VTRSYRRILELLDKHGVEFVVVGGVAAVLQGAPVTTFDIDALVKLSDDNAERLLEALRELDAHYREHGPSHRPTKSDLLAGGHLLLMTAAGPFDVLGFIGRNQSYDDLISSIEELTIGTMTVKVLSLDELIAQKSASGRDKDQAALRMLESARKRRERKSEPE